MMPSGMWAKYVKPARARIHALNTAQVGLQQKETGFNSFNGPDGGIALNEDFTFSW